MTIKVKKSSNSLSIPKTILYTSKFLEVIFPKLALLFAVKLFTTPIKHKIPKREMHMDENSEQTRLFIPTINKKIVIYKYGSSDKKILLVHGWSGRGTQLYKIADALLENGYMTISFDAPSHGKSEGKNTIMTEFIASILEIDKQFGPFEFAIGHSLGGMSILNALNRKLKLKKAVIIGSGDIILDIIYDFIKKIKLNKKYALKLKDYFEKKYSEPMEIYGSSYISKSIKEPILIMHDKDDEDVPVKAAVQINNSLINSELIITKGLGHRKILGNKMVIDKILDFFKN